MSVGMSQVRPAVLMAVATVTAMIFVGPSALLLWAAGPAVLGVVIRREIRLASCRRADRECAAEVARFAREVAAELRVGVAPRAAVARVAATLPRSGWAPAVAAAAASGADVAEALRGAAAATGVSSLRDLAVCWRLAEGAGAGLASGFAAIAGAAAEREMLRARLGAELAGVRAGGWVLGGLPLVGILLGTAVGARPLGVLLGTRPGGALLLLGLGLDAAGVLWLRRLTAAAEAVFP